MNANQYEKTPIKFVMIIPSFFNIDEDYQKPIYYYNFPLGPLQIIALLLKRKLIKEKMPMIIDIRREEELNPDGYKISEYKKEEFKKFFKKIISKYDLLEYEFIALSCYTSAAYLQTRLIASILKELKPDIKIIVGGYHPSAVPNDFLFQNSPFDFVIRGEGESFFLDLLKNGKINEPPKTRVITPEPIDINSLPFPDYLGYLDMYPDFSSKMNFELFISRGCPGNCYFCGSNFRFRNLEYIKAKLFFTELYNIAQKNDVKRFNFSDQCFNALRYKYKWLELIKKNKLNEDMEFSCQARIDYFSKKMLKKFQEANMVVGYGLESISKEMLVGMNKISIKDVNSYIKKTHEIIEFYKQHAKVRCRLNLLIGYPGETRETFFETVNYINNDSIHILIDIGPTLYSLYPNSFVYQHKDEYVQNFGIEFIDEYWKIKNLNPLKSSVIRPSRDYSKEDMILDYFTEYNKILYLNERGGKLLNKIQNQKWRTFFKSWCDELH